MNILITDSTLPQNVLVDFGFTRVTAISQDTTSFVAPELLLSTKFDPEKGISSKEVDIYVLGMTVYQVLMGKYPFFPMRKAEVMHAVI